MKRITIGLVTCMFCMLAGMASFASDNGKGKDGVPEAVWKTGQYEFPPVLEGQIVTHSFKVRNTGTGILEIRRVKTS